MSYSHLFLQPTENMPVTLEFQNRLKIEMSCSNTQKLFMPLYYKLNEGLVFEDNNVIAKCQDISNFDNLHNNF